MHVFAAGLHYTGEIYDITIAWENSIFISYSYPSALSATATSHSARRSSMSSSKHFFFKNSEVDLNQKRGVSWPFNVTFKGLTRLNRPIRVIRQIIV